MGFFDRLFGGEDQPANVPPEPPRFPYELSRVTGAEAVAQALAWRQEWRGSFTPIIKRQAQPPTD